MHTSIPQLGFSEQARRKVSARMERTVGGRPARFGLDLAACRRVIRSRWQRTIVSGRTSSRNRRTTSGGKRCGNAARKPGRTR